MDDKEKMHVSLVLPRDLYERLNEIRWQVRERSFTGLLRTMLEDSAERHESQRQEQSEPVHGL